MVNPNMQDINFQDQTLKELFQELNLKLEELNISLMHIEDQMQVLTLPLLLSALTGFFKDGKQLRAYELSDGNRSTRQIGKIVNVDQKTISTWWRVWAKDLKIMEKVGKRGQFKARYTILSLFLANYSLPSSAKSGLVSE